jgi:hypothetical protein
MAKRMVSRDETDLLDSKLLLQVLTSVKKGDFSARLPGSWTGMDGKIADTLNDIIEMMSDSNGASESGRRQRGTTLAARDSAGSSRIMEEQSQCG